MASRRTTATPAPPRASVRPPGAPAAPAAPLVGRDGELARLREAAVPGRVVTLVGPPGVGKSRLAARLVELDGGVVVPAGGAQDARTLARRAARLLGASPRATPGVRVVVDDADALDAEARRAVSAWGGAGASVIVTARAPLGVRGELVLAVSPLPLDGAARELLRELLAPGRAELATDGDPSSRARRDDVLAKLVRPTSGLPLAIELVAAMAVTSGLALALRHVERARAAVLDARLDDDALLRRAIEPAWEVLGDDERAGLAALSVFAGSFDVALATRVLGEGGEALLTSLCRRGLVHAAPDGRLQLLRPVAAFADEHLGAEARARAERRHAEAFAIRRLARPDEWEDLVAALRRALAWEGAPARDTALALLVTLEPLVAAAGSSAEHLALADDVVARAEAAGWAPEGRLRAHLVRGDAARRAGRLGDAREAFARVDAEAHARGDVALVARAARGLGAVAHVRGELALASRELERALRLARDAGDDELVGIVRSDLGTNLLALGDVVAARRELERSVDVLARRGNVLHGAGARANLGVACLDAGELVAARRELEAALDLLSGSDSIVVGFVHASLGLVEHLEGRLDAAAIRYASARCVAEDARAPRFEGTFAGYAAAVALERGDVEAAHAHALRALEALREAEEPRYEALFRAVKAAVAWWSGRDETARADVQAARAGVDPPLRPAVDTLGAALGLSDEPVAASSPPPAPPPEAAGGALPVEARLLARVTRAVAREARRRGTLPVELVLAHDAAWCRVGDDAPVSLEAPAAARALVRALVDAHARGRRATRDELVAAAWPGERPSLVSGRNRLKVLVSQLRKAGLAAVLDTTPDGYALPAGTRVVRAPEGAQGRPDLPGFYRRSTRCRGRPSGMKTFGFAPLPSLPSPFATSVARVAAVAFAALTACNDASPEDPSAPAPLVAEPADASDTPASPSEDDAAAGASPCAPAWDARGEGACRALVGYAWDGARCAELWGCRCEGSDCPRVTSGACAPETPVCRADGEDAGAGGRR